MGDNWENFYFGRFDPEMAAETSTRTASTMPTSGPSKPLPDDSDSDDDDLTDGLEINTYSTDPLDSDSDDDGFSDGDEISGGTNPNDNGSFPVVTVGRPVLGLYRTRPVTASSSSARSTTIPRTTTMPSNISNFTTRWPSTYRPEQLAYRRWNRFSTFPEGTVIDARSYLVLSQKSLAATRARWVPMPGPFPTPAKPCACINNNLALSAPRRAQVRTARAPTRSTAAASWMRSPTATPTRGRWAPMALVPRWRKSTRRPAALTRKTGRTAPASNGTPGAANGQTLVPSDRLQRDSTLFHFADVSSWSSTTTAPFPIALGGMVIGSSSNSPFTATTPSPPAYSRSRAPSRRSTPPRSASLLMTMIACSFSHRARSALINTARVDDRLKGRSPDGTGRWLNPNTATFGSANSFDLRRRLS